MRLLSRVLFLIALNFSAQVVAATYDLNPTEKAEASQLLSEAKNKYGEFRSAVTDWIEYANAVFGGEDGRYLAASSQATNAYQLSEEYGREIPADTFSKFESALGRIEEGLGAIKRNSGSSKADKLLEIYGDSPEKKGSEGIDKNKMPFPKLMRAVELLEKLSLEYLAATGQLQQFVKDARSTVPEPSSELFDDAYGAVLKTERVKKATAEMERQAALKKAEEEEYARQSAILAEQKKKEMQAKFEREQELKKQQGKAAREANELKSKQEALLAKAKDPAYQAKWAVFLADGKVTAARAPVTTELEFPGPARWYYVRKLIKRGPKKFIQCITGKLCRHNDRGHWPKPQSREQQEQYIQAYHEFVAIAPIWQRMGLFQP